MLKILILFYLLFYSTNYCDSLSVLFLGDTYFGEVYQYEPRYNYGMNYIEESGYNYFFENAEKFLPSSDISVCNLETPLVNDLNVLYRNKPYSHWCFPDSIMKYLGLFNINLVSLGNNHVIDMGTRGLISTITALKMNNVSYFGAGYSSEDALNPVITDKNGIKLIIFGGFEFRLNYDSLYHFYAGKNYPGVNMLDTLRLNERIFYYKNIYPASKIIIFPHWGSNYCNVNERQIKFAHSWINAGADAVIGHGSHTVQSIEHYRNKFIFYSIGNFIFNAPGRYFSTGAKPYGIMLKMFLSGSDTEFILYPVFTDNKKNNYKLRLLNKNELSDFEELYLKDKFDYDNNIDGYFKIKPKL